MSNANSIRKWMDNNVADFVDECNEVDCTGMVEAWDIENASGEETLDMDHIAWDISVDVAEAYMRRNRKR